MGKGLAEGGPAWEGSEGLPAGGPGPALPVLESSDHPTWLALTFLGQVPTLLSALSTAFEVCGLKGAGSRACERGPGLQGPRNLLLPW